jgi:cytochrome c-type protein NapC
VASSKTPTDYMFKSFQKLMAARDVIGKITGVVDTPEKFEAHRLEMAKRVWDRMKSRDSKECRNCHNFATMDPDKQKARSQIKHEEAQEDNITCIECHKGIAHKPIHHLLEEEAQAGQ